MKWNKSATNRNAVTSGGENIIIEPESGTKILDTKLDFVIGERGSGWTGHFSPHGSKVLTTAVRLPSTDFTFSFQFSTFALIFFAHAWGQLGGLGQVLRSALVLFSIASAAGFMYYNFSSVLTFFFIGTYFVQMEADDGWRWQQRAGRDRKFFTLYVTCVFCVG